MKFIFILVHFLFITIARADYPIAPFKTDYCTNYPEGTKTHPELWKHCCLIHDLNFWAGGSTQNRNKSDQNLKNCIHQSGAPITAWMMFLGVRIGSLSPIKYSNKKWGHGWKNRSPYQLLSVDEINLIETELASGYDFISYDIKNDFITQLRSRLD